MTEFRVEKLCREHAVEGFDCGSESLNRFLIRYALQSQAAGGSQTYVMIAGGKIAGYHTLVFGQVESESVPDRVRKGLGRYPVPIMLLARLAVALDWQSKGVGSALLKDAMLRTVQAADIAGIRALAVHAKSDHARAFYEHFDFVASPTDPHHLFLLLKEIRSALGG